MRVRPWLLIVLAVALLGSGCARAVGDSYAPTAAVVDGVKIPDTLLIGTLKLQLDPQTTAQLGGQGKAVKYLDAERRTLAGLIQTQVMVAKAPKLGVTASEGEIADRMERIRSRFESEDKMLATIGIAGLTLDSLRNEVRRGLLQDKVAAAAAKGAVPEEELRKVYDGNKGLFDIQFHVAHILICSKVDRTSGLCAVKDPQDETVASAIVGRIRGGEDFAKMARIFSEDKATADIGGDLGWLNQDRVPSNFGVAISQLQPGQVSEPIRTDLGVHIVKLLARGRSFEEARDEIEQGVGGDRLQKAVDAFLKKAIAGASITTNPKYGRFDAKSQSVVAHELSHR